MPALGKRGYVVAAALLPALEAELRRVGVPYRVVTEPVALGGRIRPVLISNDVAPYGWTRYALCVKCAGTRRLSALGEVGGCLQCQADYFPAAEALWTRLEASSHYKELKLPGWMDGCGVSSIAHVRERLRCRQLGNVGPEREALVDAALATWRERVLKLLNG